jgi:uncharacterized protein with von Willebrand factor type A (vWA) domain
MLTALLDFVHRLRGAGIPVSMVEAIDAAEALARVDLSNRREFRATLAATLVKRGEHRAAFGDLFDVCFAPHRDPIDRPGRDPGGPAPFFSAGGGAPDAASVEMLQTLLDALRRNDADALRSLAALAVGQFAGIPTQQGGSERYYLYRVLRQLDLSNLLQRTMRQERDDPQPGRALTERLRRDEHERRLEAFRQLIAEEIRQRLLELRGPDAIAAAYAPTLIEDVDFLSASPDQLRAMRRAIRPLARKLAARIARRRRFRRGGRLDVRRTIRRSLSAGGVPLDPAFRRPRESRPDLFLLCDVSGSVAEFARFTMAFLHAMGQEFSRIRSFAFVDGIDEVTAAVGDGSTVLDAHQLLSLARVVWADGHSDYGNVFRRFWDGYGHAGLGRRATVLITGDGRNNYRDAGLSGLRAIAERARRVYWLNPEPGSQWNTTDSIVATYAPHCDGVFEVRSLRQLADFVDAIV